jgi:hypothetical protein
VCMYAYHDGEGGTALCDNLVAAKRLGGAHGRYFDACIPLVGQLRVMLAM